MPANRKCRYLIAPDSFKGSFSATEVAEAIAGGVREAGAEADVCPVADGGEGTLDVLLAAGGGTRVEADAHDPLRRPIRAGFGLLAGGETAVVEVAAASGLPLLAPDERDPERADTFGTGELIAAAITAGAKTILVAAGGSATTDGGRGAIEALRAGGGLQGARLEVLCDVETPYEDAARVFAPQKGAEPAAVARLAARLDDFARTLRRDPRGVPMGGCAGGLSGGLMAAFDADLRPGARFVLDRLGFATRLDAADAVITGEGQIDDQSLRGKVVGTVAGLCAEAGRPLHVIAGRNALAPERAVAAGISSIVEASSLDEIAVAGRAAAAT
ncbi:MAG: glycerate kinase [Solirubrobacterales bacterium]